MDASGQVVIPRGSPAQLVIDEIKGGGMTGTPTLALDLRSVTVNGRPYLAETGKVEQTSGTGQGADKQTTTMAGGARLGTLIGTVSTAGEPAISTTAGAVGGVLAHGSEVQVPADILLIFRLDQPLRLQAAP